MKLEPDEARLLALARAQPIADPEVRRVWEVVCEAIAQRWLTPAGRLSLQALIDALASGGGAGAEEYSIDVDDQPGAEQRVVASWVSDRYRCSRSALLTELRRLEATRRERSRG